LLRLGLKLGFVGGCHSEIVLLFPRLIFSRNLGLRLRFRLMGRGRWEVDLEFCVGGRWQCGYNVDIHTHT